MVDGEELTHAAVLGVIRRGIRSVRGPEAEIGDLAGSTGLWGAEDPGQPNLGFDSLDLLELVIYLEEELGWEIPEERIDAEGWRTLGDLASAVMSIAESAGQTVDG